MGQPEHYSRDLPQRCMRLIDDLWPVVAQNEHGGEFGGPLTTTFLMSLATPILVLPFERIIVQGNAGAEVPSYANDANIDAGLTERLKHGLAGRLEDKPFHRAGSWSVVETDNDYFKLPEGLPDHIAGALAAEEAYHRASRMQAESLLACLRNALSHGGISYLDAKGRTTNAPHEQVSMLAFISARMKGQGKERKPIGLRIARISEEDFRVFLREWVEWLSGAR